MTEVHSKALDQTISVDRIIGKLKGKKPGPTLIFTAGIHGNEPSGVFALKKVTEELKNQEDDICGNVIAISGHLWALEKGVRFQQEDLNRIWTKERVAALSDDWDGSSEDINQQVDILKTIVEILENESGPFYFFDLHTTSSETLPFLTINDSLLNRKFTTQYPLPIILGIEEYLEGPLLSYINELGYVAFGFEAGQHDDLGSIESNIAFIYLSFVFCGVMRTDQFNYNRCYEKLAKTTGDIRKIYEIYFRYLIKPDEKFQMLPGFYNFQRVRKNQDIAKSGEKTIKAQKDGRIFMPLYQAQGSDGFFAIRRVRPIFLVLSAMLRKIRFDHFLTLLPGIKWSEKRRHTLVINRRVAILFVRQFFHLLGYRSRSLDKNRYLMKNREEYSRDKEYQNESWIN